MTATPYSFGLGAPEPEKDQRQEFRLAGRVIVTLELEAPGPEEDERRILVRSDSSDVSASGLRLTTCERLLPGALLPASLELTGEGPGFELMVEVIWCRQVPSSNLWQSGLRIVDTGDEHYLAWLDTMARLMAGEQG